MPVWFAAPVAWLAVMYLQKTLMGGFGFAPLEHTQVKQTALIQLADIGGESLVGSVMIFVGVLFGYCLPVSISVNSDNTKEYVSMPSSRQVAASLVAVSLTFLSLVCYARIREYHRVQSDQPPLRVALLQGNFKASLSAPPEWYDEVFEQYKKLAIDVSRNNNHKIDVIIWPESTCIYPWIDIDRSEFFANISEVMNETEIKELLLENNEEIIELTQTIGIPCIYGVNSFVFWEKEKFFQYNSALLIDIVDEIDYDSHGQVQPFLQFYRYDKMLLVMFGEYVPFTEHLPEGFFLKSLCRRADFGRAPVQFFLSKINDNKVDNITNIYSKSERKFPATTNICFESSSSFLIRQQLLSLRKKGDEPDILINISNDGWFRHSSQIDMHLATHVFRAIENRKPYLASTNGGFSVGIDGSGNILSIGKRAKNQVVYVDLTPDKRFSAFLFCGSVFHLSSLGFIFIVLLFQFFYRKNSDTLPERRKFFTIRTK